MGLRTALASRLSRAAVALGGEPGTAVEKAFGSNEPPEMAQAAHDVSQMDMQHPFAPGEPIGPYDGYSRTPRSFDYLPAVNIATRPRTHEAVSFSALKGLIGAYDVASICIWHRIDSLRSLDWKLVAADGYAGDVTDAIAIGMAALEKPDRVNSFGTWLARYLYNILAYDAGALYRMRNRGGKCVGLKVVDGPTLAPLIDYWGDPPEPPAEAYVQYANGVPWGWATRDDIIYEPFRPRTDSPYGTAPLESIMLNANTDVRFQWHFLQRFTEGNIPAAFASAPESWSPQQIEAFQELWDSFMYGDQSRKSQIRWLPGGSTFTWTNEKDFTDAFSLFMMRKSCAAYHIVPTDIGFTENSNYSTGESQADVGHRVGDLPLGRHVERILTGFLQSRSNGLGLPLKHQFDWGEEQDDRLNQAQADQLMIDRAVISSSEVRQMRYGLAEPEGQVVPRFIYSPRAGAIPLSALMDVAGPTDVQTAAPEPGQPLPHHEFAPIEGVVPVPPPKVPALAERLYGPDAIPPPPPEQGAPVDASAPVSKEAAALPAGATEGITSETGIYGYDGPGDRGEDEDGPQQEVLKEIATFRRFARARIRTGTWRDFTFISLGGVDGHNLNDAGRLAVRKAAGEIAVAGIAVLASDTGRVLMLQRALSDSDPAGGTFEFPGGHVEGDEQPRDAALREWQEETGLEWPGGDFTAMWLASNGIYQGFVYTIPSEDGLDIHARCLDSDPDGDVEGTETIAWWDPADLPGNPAIRPELLADMDQVLTALGVQPVAKAAPAPKASAPQGASQPAAQPQPAQQAWPGWQYDLAAAAFWASLLAAALAALDLGEDLTEAWLSLGATSRAGTKRERITELVPQAREWLTGRDVEDAIAGALDDVITGTLTDGYAIGAASATAAHLGAITADMAGWEPGASSVARELVGNLGGGEGLRDLLDRAGVTVKSIADTELDRLARILAEGAENGTSARDLADSIRGLLSDPSRAEMIVGTELARAANNAAMWAYRLHGIKMVQWVTAEDASVCPACDAEEAKGPQPLNDAAQPPLHPRCRCSLVPA